MVKACEKYLDMTVHLPIIAHKEQLLNVWNSIIKRWTAYVQADWMLFRRRCLALISSLANAFAAANLAFSPRQMQVSRRRLLFLVVACSAISSPPAQLSRIQSWPYVLMSLTRSRIYFIDCLVSDTAD